MIQNSDVFVFEPSAVVFGHSFPTLSLIRANTQIYMYRYMLKTSSKCSFSPDDLITQ